MTRWIKILAVLVPFIPAAGAATFTARDFVRRAPAAVISNEDEMTEKAKQRLLRAHFALPADLCEELEETDDYYSTFFVDDEKPEHMTFRSCAGSRVVVHVWPRLAGGAVVTVVSINGNHGQYQDATYHLLDRRGRYGGTIAPEELGIREIRENELLSTEDAFADDDNWPVPLFLQDDGTIKAEPWTWNEPRWEDKLLEHEVAFRWNGRSFVVVIDEE
jgi:hypothetical protein